MASQRVAGADMGPLEAERRANPLSWAIWWYLAPLLSKGYKQPLEMSDLGDVQSYDSARVLADRLAESMGLTHTHTHTPGADGAKPARDRPHLGRAMLTWELGPVVCAGLCKLIGDLLGFLGPLSLAGIVRFVGRKAAGLRDDEFGGMELGYWWLIVSFVSALLQNWLLQSHHQLVIRAGSRIKAALGILVFRKALRIDAAKRAEIGNGKIQNMQSGDATAVNMVYWFIHYTWSAPLQLAICMAMLYAQLGPSAFVGLGVTIALVPLQGVLGASLAKYTKIAAQHADTRVKLVNEAVSGIRIIKYFAFEDNFHKRITATRKLELAAKRNLALVNAFNQTLTSVGPLLVALLSFLTYGFSNSATLTSTQAFTSLTLFSILRLPLMVLPMLASSISSARVSASRLTDFFSQPDGVDRRTFVVDPAAPRTAPIEASALNSALNAGSIAAVPPADVAIVVDAAKAEPGTAPSIPNGVALELVNATCTWQEPPSEKEAAPNATADAPASAPAAAPFALSGMSVQFPRGKLTSIVGSVGSGKSSLLAAILGDMNLTDGAIRVYVAPHAAAAQPDDEAPTFAFCSQQPWIQNATLKENILFGLPLDAERYTAVLKACALEPDIAVLPAGDSTEIGERGVNLSGGQKARVALARAVYSASPIIVLDDVLSAVDAHVARHIFTHAIRGFLAGRTIIMATHQLQFVAESDKVVVLRGGHVTQQGSYDALLADTSAESNLLRDMMAERHRIDEGLAASSAAASLPTGTKVAHEIVKQASSRQRDEATPADKPAAPAAEKGKLMTEEDRFRGSVPANVYTGYMLAMGPVMLALMVVTLLITNTGNVGTDWWLSYWSDGRENRSVGYYIGVYAAITLSTGLVTLIYMFTWAFGSVSAALALHDGMLVRVLRSPMSFFDSTPVGRILNRFSTDIDTIDRQLPTSFSSVLSLLTRCLATVIVQAIIFPWILLGIAPITLMYVFVQTYYRSSMREVKRLDSITRSPVFAHLAETLTGLPTLRAYAAFTRFERMSETRMDRNQVAGLTLQLLNRWLGLRLDWIGALLVGATSLVAVLTAGRVDPGLVGLAISYSMSITNLLNWLVRNMTETETFLSSVERVQFYTELPVERPAIIASNRPPQQWPSKGEITFDKLTVRYRPDLDPVLRNITLRIAPGEKVGVCGRTGAGKSSMMLALYRILEAEAGSVTVDGINIADIGLEDLRSRLAIIPQDPILFSGSVRYNLDVVGDHSDEQLWSALERVQMKDKVRGMEGGLDGKVAEGGDNFSVGERQLLCTARALLRGARIVVLDEATASTDVLSDSIIQTMLRTQFPNVTMLIIAHRVNTILDADKILVLDQGTVAEYAPPAQLLADSSSRFAGLVRESANASH